MGKTMDEIYVGRRFEKLTVLHEVEGFRGKNGCISWVCRCDCGKIVRVSSTNLRSGNTRSCGCIRMKDLTGQRFGRLVARTATKYRMGSSVIWECKCDCGSVAFVSSANLVTGNTRSCGCLWKETREVTARMRWEGKYGFVKGSANV